MTDYLILRVTAKFLIPLILLMGLYVQFHGELGPGGGFQAGVIFSAGLILYALVFGLYRLTQSIPVFVLKVLSSLGVLLFAGTGVVTMLLGGEFLNYSLLAENAVTRQHLGIFLVELGVGITVASTMLLIFAVFAEQEDHD